MQLVALRKESVDRNGVEKRLDGFQGVALRKESVDRNMGASYGRTAKMVALRKESVDRNNFGRLHYNVSFMVALRKESVDRNLGTVQIIIIVVESLSARRAWIEM